MDFRPLDFADPQVAAMLRAHLDEMRSISPPESVHALDPARMRALPLTMWAAWEGDQLRGCGGLARLDAGDCEVKSMHVAAAARGQGVGRRILAFLLDQARAQGFSRVLLETGSSPAFAAARALYERQGFAYRGPFAGYAEDPHSVFMQLQL